jgi:hypothetical protein
LPIFLAIAGYAAGSPICLLADAPTETARLVNLGSEIAPEFLALGGQHYRPLQIGGHHSIG